MRERDLRRKIRRQLRSALVEAKLNEKKWADFNAPKGKDVELSPDDFKDDDPNGERDLDDEIFDLIQTAYAEVELEPGQYGNAKVRSPADLPGGYTVMQAADIDDDPDPDFFRGGKMRNGRYKLGIVGHDGSKAAIQKYLDQSAEKLKSGGIAEMSGAIAHIMITRYGVSSVNSKEEVESMLGKPVDWVGRHPEEKRAVKYGDTHEGWYFRDIAGAAHMKILLGGA